MGSSSAHGLHRWCFSLVAMRQIKQTRGSTKSRSELIPMSDFSNINWSPEDYQQAAFLAKESGEEMLSRLEWMTIQPKVIVDVGAGLGEVALGLHKQFPEAKVYAVDSSPAMQKQLSQLKGIFCLADDAATLSLPDDSVDLLCANFLLPYVGDIKACLKEWRRVLKADGLLMLTTLGVGNLQELQRSVNAEQFPVMIDMHDVGDMLVTSGFADPVIDVGRFPVKYSSLEKMQYELHASCMLSGDVKLAQDQGLLVTFEVVHAHAFAPQASNEFAADESGTVRVPLSHLRRSLG